MGPRIVFFGYSEVGFECLSLLVERGDNVVALITHEDHPDEKIWFKTPAAVAQAQKIPLFAPATVNTPEWIERMRELKPELIVSAYYRALLCPAILDTARLGAFNLHGSLLPRYRGRAPINWAVLHGETRIGMTLHRMVRRADAGAIVDQEGVELGSRDTAEQAFRKVLPCARRILGRQMDRLLAGTASEYPQDESQATYYGARRPDDGRIDWRKTSTEIFNLIRAVTAPFPGAFTEFNGTRLMVWWAEPDSPAASDVTRRTRPTARDTRNAARPALNADERVPRPGEILSLAPLLVATADGALELTRCEWREAVPPELRVGQLF